MENGKPELMHHMVHPKLPGVYFLGFIQAHGPMIPCFEAQMPYAADLIQAGFSSSVLRPNTWQLSAIRDTRFCGLELPRLAAGRSTVEPSVLHCGARQGTAKCSLPMDAGSHRAAI